MARAARDVPVASGAVAELLAPAHMYEPHPPPRRGCGYGMGRQR